MAVAPLAASTVPLATARYGQAPPAPPPWLSTPPVAAEDQPSTAHYTLYVACCFMRHNLARRFDGAGHTLALRVWAWSLYVMSLSPQSRQPTHPGGRGMDWNAIWTAVVDVPLFLHAKFDSLEPAHKQSASIAGRAAIYALAQGLALVPYALPPAEGRSLVYEVVRAKEALASLALRVTTEDQQAPSARPPGWNVIEAVTSAVMKSLHDAQGRLTRSAVNKAIDQIDLPDLLAKSPKSPPRTTALPSLRGPAAASAGAPHDLLLSLGLMDPEPVPRWTLSSAAWAVAEDTYTSIPVGR